jgi:hypothetical protein
MDAPTETHQQRFHRRWPELTEPHVRALAWLLDAPDLLDPAAPEWQGAIATLPVVEGGVRDWLLALQADPAPLHQALGPRPYTRIGLYAEKLMAFYFQAQGLLVRHGLQVRNEGGATIGEFDFLLDGGRGGLVHLEFATKFYLLRAADLPARLDAFVGPNLADSLGRKMRKIFERQLGLGREPAAQASLPAPVLRAQALVKGWLFYPAAQAHGLATACADTLAELDQLTQGGHCRGLWCEAAGLPAAREARFVILPRLEWLAPWQGEGVHVQEREALLRTLAERWAGNPVPQLVAQVEQAGALWREQQRLFVVPEGWSARPLLGLG